MRAFLQLAAGALVSLVCLTSVGVLLIYILSGNHGASWSNVGLALPFLTWGLFCGAALLVRKPWAPKLFVSFAVATSAGLGACGFTEVLSWPNVVSIVIALFFVSSLVVVSRPNTRVHGAQQSP